MQPFTDQAMAEAAWRMGGLAAVHELERAAQMGQG
jgi:hypothetical protein